MALLKDIYSRTFYDRLADSLAHSIPAFNKKKFLEKIFTTPFGSMELKERMRHTTIALHDFLPENYAEAVKLLAQIIKRLREERFGEDNLAFIFLPDYIALYGLDDYKNSVKALEFTTQFISCEFAVRPFIVKYGDRMIEQMVKWSLHPDAKVRRLSSEGSRPRLPWAIGIPALKINPAGILPILEHLKQDPSESVRRSVANSLNDIAKDHPEVVIRIAAAWKGLGKETDAIIKHGSRTLLKQGHHKILAHYGLKSAHAEATNLKVITPKVKIGGSLEFSFSIRNLKKSKQTIRLEYAIYYNKKNGLLAKKVFRISEKIYQAEESAEIIRRHSFRLITTRVFYTGYHELSLLVNGAEKSKGNFMLIPSDKH